MENLEVQRAGAPPRRLYLMFSRLALPGPNSPKGLTLIELAVVILILGVVMAIVFPKFMGLGQSRLKNDTGKVSTLLGYINEAAITKKVYYRVWFDLGQGRLRVESSRDGVEFIDEKEGPLRSVQLKDGVEIKDIVLPALGKIEGGSASFVFPPGGAVDSFTLHLGSGEDVMTLYFNPVTGRVAVEEGYLHLGLKHIHHFLREKGIEV